MIAPMKRLLIIALLFLGTLIIYNVALEWSLDVTARKFGNELVKAKQGGVLRIAIKTYDWPRVYRKSTAYEDLHALVMTMLYLDSEKDAQKSIWGIRTAVSLLDEGVGKYPGNTKEGFFSRLKRISIINRMPELFAGDGKNINQEVQQLLSIGQSIAGVSNESISYLYIERMFNEVNTGANKSAIEQSFNDALKQLESGNPDAFAGNKKKFEFYYGYAQCLEGEAEGGQLMLDSFNYLSQNSNSFSKGMFVNWDWPLIGTLKSVNSKGYAACHEAAGQMKRSQ